MILAPGPSHTLPFPLEIRGGSCLERVVYPLRGGAHLERMCFTYNYAYQGTLIILAREMNI
jgi:hypothetical protein